MKNFKTKIKIIAIIGVSLVIVRFVTPKVFIANTPQVNPLFISQIIGLPNKIASLINKGNPKENNNSNEDLNKIAAYKGETSGDKIKPSESTKLPDGSVIFQIGKGAYAAEDRQTNKSYIMFKDDAQVKVYEYTLPDGKKIILYEPVQ